MDKDLLDKITQSMREIYNYANPAYKLFVAKLNLSTFKSLRNEWIGEDLEAIEDHMRFLECNVRESYPEIPDSMIPDLISTDGYKSGSEEFAKCQKRITAAMMLNLGKMSS